MVSQIPKVIYAATTGHTKLIRTPVGTFSFHKISPPLFAGFDWYKNKESFLIASPEKALVDSLYIASRRGNRFGNFPELNFPKAFSFKKTEEWTELIKEQKIRSFVQNRLKEIEKNSA